MIFSNIWGDCTNGDFDIIVRGSKHQVKHELMHVLIEMDDLDVIEIIDAYLKYVTDNLHKESNNEI